MASATVFIASAPLWSSRKRISVADADIDLAILRVSGLRGTTARLRDPGNVLLGEPVLVFGYPYAGALSSGGNFTSGVVSALRGLRDSANQLQITSPVQPGNSGGPLMDSSGLAIGVIQSKLSFNAARLLGDIPQNVNFAISLEALAQFLAKHKVAFQTAPRSPALDTARVAEMAQKFTHRIECNLSDQRENIERTVKVPSNKETRIGVYVNLKPDCTSGPLPSIRLISVPEHGKVTIKQATVNATNYKQCSALQVPGFVAYYQPARDFFGTDSLSLEIKSFSGRTIVQKITLPVAP
jgi:Trypsin-like peptidase domain